MSAGPEPAATAVAPGEPVFRRILLKLSGEALMGDREYGIDPRTVGSVARSMPSAAAAMPR